MTEKNRIKNLDDINNLSGILENTKIVIDSKCIDYFNIICDKLVNLGIKNDIIFEVNDKEISVFSLKNLD